MNNRRNTGMLGMLGSRVPKGQSLADRMNRLENHIFDLRKELLSNGMMELTSSFKDDMNEIKDSHASLMDMLRKAGLGDADGILSQLVAMDAANKLKSNDPYIIDSLGWALYKLKRFKESKNFLQQAVQLMPADPIVNDHFGDVLWKNGNKLQARYYWNYVLNLEKAEKELIEKVEQKLIKGL